MKNEQIHEMAQKLRLETVRMVYEGKTDIQDQRYLLQILWQHFILTP